MTSNCGDSLPMTASKLTYGPEVEFFLIDTAGMIVPGSFEIDARAKQEGELYIVRESVDNMVEMGAKNTNNLYALARDMVRVATKLSTWAQERGASLLPTV